MAFLLKLNGTDKYVAPAGSERSYTAKKDNARRFATRDEAEQNRCIHSETIVEEHR